MRRRPRSSRLLVVVALVALPLACGDYGSLGDLVTDSGTGTGPMNPGCDPIQLADVAAGIGGFAVDGEAEGNSGSSVSTVGDMNGDGLAEVIVGAKDADLDSEPWSGRSYVVFGKADTDKVQLSDVSLGAGGFVVRGGPENDVTHTAVSGVGDTNGDGIPDVVVGVRTASPNETWQAGRTYVVFGKADANSVMFADVAQGVGGFAMDGEGEGDYSGSSVSGAGDMDGDGLADLVVGAPGAAPDCSYFCGRTYVVFGKADTDKVTLEDVAAGVGGFGVDGEGEDDQSGLLVSGAGDVNGDGISDVAIGTCWEYSTRAYVVFGKANTSPVSLADVSGESGGFALEGEAPNACPDNEGLRGAGDVNGDGLDDVILGAHNADPNDLVLAGRTFVVFGKADADTVRLADIEQGIGGFVIDGEAAEDGSGDSVSAAGDINGDGLADLIVAAPEAGPNGVDRSGRTYVVFGKADGESVSLARVAQGIGGFALDGEGDQDSSGRSVSGAADMNGDGVPDIVIGAPGHAPNGFARSGRTYVIFGDACSDAGG